MGTARARGRRPARVVRVDVGLRRDRRRPARRERPVLGRGDQRPVLAGHPVARRRREQRRLCALWRVLRPSSARWASTPAPPGPVRWPTATSQRDFPIIQAFDDHLVVGRFGWDTKSTTGDQPGNRVIVGADKSNVPFLQLAQCCFHHQATFKVRTGGEWVTVGQNGLGMLHHVQVGRGRGAASCRATPPTCSGTPAPSTCPSSRRMPRVPPRARIGSQLPATTPAGPQRRRGDAQPDVLVLHPAGHAARPPRARSHTLAQRDMQWQFSMTGGFSPISISLNAGTGAGVSPSR